MKTVLLVDDEEITRIFVHLALKRFTQPVHLRYLRDGLQAMRYLEGYGIYSDRKAHPFPELVLLDLKMPLIDGFEVLQWAHSHPALQNLPIVVLTESTYEADNARALHLGATAFVTKSVDLTEFEQAVKNAVGHLLTDSPPPPQLSTHLPKAA